MPQRYEVRYDDIISACQHGDLPRLRVLREDMLSDQNFPKDSHALSKGLPLACFYGHLDVVKFIYEDESDYMKELVNFNDPGVLESIVGFASASGRLDIVRYLFTSIPMPADVDYEELLLWSLRSALRKAYYDIAEYLLTSPELKQQADVNYRDGAVFAQSCMLKNHKAISFLLTSPIVAKNPLKEEYIELGLREANEETKSYVEMLRESKRLNDKLSDTLPISEVKSTGIRKA